MFRTFGKRLFDKLHIIKKSVKKTNFYYSIRDHIFIREMRKEIRIENKNDFELKKNYVKKWYKQLTGIELNLEKPISLTEKQQWLKLYDDSEIKSYLSDKIKVRSYIEEKLGKQYLVPLIPIEGEYFFNDAKKIDFNKLPNSFVIACNHGSSMTIVVENKNNLSKRNIKNIKKRLNRWLRIDPTYIGAFDYTYKDIEPKIMITKYLTNNKKPINDLKIMCFNGKPVFLWIDSDRFTSHKRTVFNLDGTKADFCINNYKSTDCELPPNYKTMLSLAEKLCINFNFIRVDFYYTDSEIYFGELTFNSGGGVELPYPLKFNKILGDLLTLPKLNK